MHIWFDTLHEEHRDPSRTAPYGHITSGPYNYARKPRTQKSPPDPTPSDSDDSTSSSPPPLIDASSDEDDPYDRHPEIPDKARNAIHRRYAQMQTRMHLPYSNPPRLTVAGHTVVDIRVASHDYDSSSIYPDPSDSSDGDTPHYWLETTNPTPPASNLPPPVMITDRQLMEWIESQLLWNIFRQRIPIFRDTPIELCGTPQPPICTNMQLPMPTHSTPYTYIRLLAAQRFILIKLPHHPTSNHPKTLPQYAAYPQRPPRNLPPSTLHDLQLRRVLGPTRCRHPDLKVAQTLPHLRQQRQ